MQVQLYPYRPIPLTQIITAQANKPNLNDEHTHPTDIPYVPTYGILSPANAPCPPTATTNTAGSPASTFPL
jgi:hypothetical protein